MTQKFYSLKTSFEELAYKEICIINVNIFDPKSLKEVGDAIYIANDKIIDFGNVSKFDEMRTKDDCITIDGQGKLLVPALIDLQVHFRDPGQFEKEDVVSGSKSAVAGGIGTVVCQPNTSPTLDNAQEIEKLYSKAKNLGYCELYAYGAVTKGLLGEEATNVEELVEAGVVGFTDDGLPISDTLQMRRIMEKVAKHGSLMAQHAQDLSISNGGCINEGEVSKKLGVTGIPTISESIMVLRDIEIARYVGGHYHVLHVSTQAAVHAIRQAKKDANVHITAEAAPHHFELTEKSVLEIGTYAKMNPPLRTEKDRIAVIEGLQDGTIDAIATDHAPHDAKSKNTSLDKASFGIIGTETMLPISLNLWKRNILSLYETIRKMTYEPAKILSLNNHGIIEKGAIANLTLIDPEYSWIFSEEDIISRSKNSPFLNHKLSGRALLTIVQGRIVYVLNDKILSNVNQ